MRVRPRTETRLYLAYRGCGRLEHRNRWSHSNRSQCECKANRSSECLIKASHCRSKGCRSKSSKCRSYGRCSSNRPRGSLSGHCRNLQQPPARAPPPPASLPPCSTLRPWAASRATAASAAAAGGFGPPTQREYVEQVHGSDSDNNPEDALRPWKKQKVQMYRENAHHNLLAKKNLWPCKTDLRGVSRCSI